jgi:lysyl-tRNA synthetase class 2
MPKARDQVLLTAILRHKAFKQIRAYFDQRSFLEIDAPILLDANAVEAQIDPLSTQVQSVDARSSRTKFLATSPEIHMKRLLAHGAEQIYSLGPVFRDREDSPIHRTEFILLEWYRARSDLDDLILDCEQIFSELAITLNGSAVIRRSDQQDLDLSGPFDRVSVASAWEKYADIDLESALAQIAQGNKDALTKAVVKSGESLRENADFDDAFTHIMLKKIEPQIGNHKPCVLFDWPAQTAALARLSPANPLFSQRFEIYCGGVELANAFSELTDPIEQRARFIEANEIRVSCERSQLPMPEEFLADLSKMPASCGIALGVDRLIALISGKNDLRKVLCFPN